MVEQGRYKARANHWEVAEVESTGSLYVAIRFQLSEYVHLEVWAKRFLTPNAMQYTLDDLRKLGWQGDDLADIQGLNANEVEIVVAHEKYEDRDGNERVTSVVKWINEIGRAPSIKNTVAADKLKAFAASVRGEVVAHKQAAGAPKNNGAPPQQQRRSYQAPQGGTGGGNDDLPF